MNWLDSVAILAIIVVIGLEGWRKFGRALFDAVGALISVYAAHWAQPGLASLVSFSADPKVNQGVAFAVVFGILVVLTVVASKYLYGATMLNLPEAFEGSAGALLGVISAIVVSHAIAFAVFTSAGGAANIKNPYTTTVAVQQLVKWDGYHQALTALKNLGT